jgi:hypothetical protein
MNKDEILKLKFPLWSDEYGAYIFDADGVMFCEMRGWGRLQKAGEKEGIEEQKRRQKFILDACNKYKELYEETPPAETHEVKLSPLSEEEKEPIPE